MRLQWDRFISWPWNPEVRLHIIIFTAAELRTIEAISAYLISLRQRSQLLPYLEGLTRALKLWRSQLDPESSQLDSVKTICLCADEATRKTAHHYRGTASGNPITEVSKPYIESQEAAKDVVRKAGFVDREAEQMEALCIYGSNLAQSQDDEVAPETGRSVRAL